MRTAFITGSTRGIGRSIAIQLSQQGYRVIINGTKQPQIYEAVQEIIQAGGQAIGICGDVGDPGAVTDMVESMIRQCGRIDVLIHNAGNLHDQKCLRMSDEAWRSVLDTHLNGAFYCIQRILPYMQENGGDILLMTSTAGLRGSVGQVNYSAAKAGMLGMVWTLAAELQRYGIRVNAISPAALTAMTRPVIEHLTAKHAARNEALPEFWRVGEAEDVARFVAALLAQPDKELTGEIFAVNGSKITRWQRPAPTFSAHGSEAFFETWRQQKGEG